VLSPVYVVGQRVDVTVEGQSIVTVMVEYVCAAPLLLPLRFRPAEIGFGEVPVGYDAGAVVGVELSVDEGAESEYSAGVEDETGVDGSTLG